MSRAGQDPWGRRSGEPRASFYKEKPQVSVDTQGNITVRSNAAQPQQSQTQFGVRKDYQSELGVALRGKQVREVKQHIIDIYYADDDGNDDQGNGERDGHATDLYCDVRTLKNLLKFFIGVVSHFRSDPTLKFKFDELGFIGIADIEEYLSIKKNTLLPSLKHSTRPFYEIQNDRKVRFDYQMFLENFCKSYSQHPMHKPMFGNHSAHNSNGLNGAESQSDNMFYINVEFKNICPFFCGFGAYSLYIVQKGIPVYTSAPPMAVSNDRIILPFKLHPVYDDKSFPLCNYLFSKYKSVKSIQIYQNRQNAEVAFIPRSFIEWEKASFNVLPLVSPFILSIDRYFIGGNESNGYFLLVIDRVSGKRETFQFNPGELSNLRDKLVEYIPSYSCLKDNTDSVSFRVNKPTSGVEVSKVNSSSKNNNNNNNNNNNSVINSSFNKKNNNINVTIVSKINNETSDQEKREAIQIEMTDISINDKPNETASSNVKSVSENENGNENENNTKVQTHVERNSYGFMPASNSNILPICIVGNISEISEIMKEMKSVIINPNVIIPVDKNGITSHSNNINNRKDFALEFVNAILDRGKEKTVVSDGYYYADENKIIITKKEKICEAIRNQLSSETSALNSSKNETQTTIEYTSCNLKTLPLTDINDILSGKPSNSASTSETARKDMLINKHSDFYVLSWNVLLQHFNVVSELPMILNSLESTKLHPNYNNSIYALKMQNILKAIKNYVPDIICLQEADEVLSNKINKISFGVDDLKKRNLYEQVLPEVTTANITNTNTNSAVPRVSILPKSFSPYTSILCDRGLSSGLRTGVLTAFNSKKYTRLFTITIPFSDLINTDISRKYLSGKFITKSDSSPISQEEKEKLINPVPSSLSYPYNRQSAALIVALENIKTKKCVIVLNVHTYWSPSYEGVRVLEGINCLETLKIAVERVKKHINSRNATVTFEAKTGQSIFSFNDDNKNNTTYDINKDIAVLLVGDLNDKPSNELYALISKGFTDYMVGVDSEENDVNEAKYASLFNNPHPIVQNMPDIDKQDKEKNNDSSIENTPTIHTYTHQLQLKSSLSLLPTIEQNPTNMYGPHKFVGEPYSTTKVSTFEATIDYIFHNPTLRVSEVINDELHSFIPDNHVPSDHRVGMVGFSWL